MISKFPLKNFNKPYMRMRAYRKGFTLVELSIVMSITAILLGGFSTIIVFTSQSINKVGSDSNNLFMAKEMLFSFDNVLDQNNGQFTLFNSVVNDDEANPEITKEDILNSTIIFTTINSNLIENKYVFCKQNFGYYTNIDGEFHYTNIFSSKTKLKLEFVPDNSTDNYCFCTTNIYYGNNYEFSLSLSKKVSLKV